MKIKRLAKRTKGHMVEVLVKAGYTLVEITLFAKLNSGELYSFGLLGDLPEKVVKLEPVFTDEHKARYMRLADETVLKGQNLGRAYHVFKDEFGSHPPFEWKTEFEAKGYLPTVKTTNDHVERKVSWSTMAKKLQVEQDLLVKAIVETPVDDTIDTKTPKELRAEWEAIKAQC